jgi:hypothetical protein
MPSVFIEFPKTELRFHLFDHEVDQKMMDKMKNLGLPKFSVEYPLDPRNEFTEGADGLYRIDGFQTGSFPVNLPTATSKYSAFFDRRDNAIIVNIEGQFFCYNDLEEGQVEGGERTVGFVFVTRLRNSNGKIIKKAKDKWGMADPIEALAEKGVYDGAGALKVAFSIQTDSKIFYS